METLREAVAALEGSDVRYVLIGGLGSSVYGRPRSTEDVDVLVRPDDASPALEALGAAGFDTEETDPHWIYKATRDSVTVDVLFKVSGDIYLDDEMQERAQRHELHGVNVWVAPPEDLLVIKAIAHDEPSFRHWHDALGILAGTRGDLDWDYLARRAGHGARRVLSLLVYAQSNDLVVPDAPIRELFARLYETPG
jgi:predicted nucleotidyltransferase